MLMWTWTLLYTGTVSRKILKIKLMKLLVNSLIYDDADIENLEIPLQDITILMRGKTH